MDKLISYSLDMVRLKVRVPTIYFENYAERFECNPSVTFWEAFGYKEYRYNWKVDQEGFNGDFFSFWIGYKHNMENVCERGTYSLVVEFNPNKCIDVGLLGDILDKFMKFDHVTLQSCDVAIDFEGVNIRDTFYDRGKKRMSQDLYYSDNRTYYIGKGPGRVKVYDKAEEMGLSDVELTRYEVTLSPKIDFDCLGDYVVPGGLPVVYDLRGGCDSIDKSIRAEVFACLHGFPMSDLSYYKRKKIKDHLSDNILQVDESKITNCLLGWATGFRS